MSKRSRGELQLSMSKPEGCKIRLFLQLVAQTSNRVQIDESDTVSQLNLTDSSVKEIVS